MAAWQPLSERSVAVLLERAGEYRRMAETARSLQVMASLHKLADAFEALARDREAQEADKLG